MNISWQGWELHHLARRAKIFGIEKKYIDILEKYGWYLNKQQNTPPEMNSNLNEAILRLGSIDNFDKSCDKQGCSICKSIKEIFINQGNSINSTNL